MLSDVLFAALGGQEGTVREMDVDMPVLPLSLSLRRCMGV